MLITDSAATTRILRMFEEEASSGEALVSVAQRCCDAFYETFEESVVLARIFLTLPYRALPAAERSYADDMARRLRVSSAVEATTPVITLLGTRGRAPAWNDRALSQGHRAIPLVSVELVESLPMMEKLFRELDPELSWLSHRDHKIVEKNRTASPGGLFFVEEAAHTLDPHGRKVIGAQDFVRENGVEAVFGVARCFREDVFLVMLAFLRHPLTRERARHFLPIVPVLRGATLRAIDAGRVFEPAG